MRKPVHHLSIFQIARNIVSNVAFVVADVLINLWYTPFLLRKLGSELFGFIPLTNSVTNYFSIVTYSMNIPIGRHVTMELEKGDVHKANQIFNTNLVATLILISLAVPIGVVLVAFAPVLFTIPTGREREVQFLFVAVITSFLIGTYRINFKIATFAKNRFDLRNVVLLSTRIAQILVIISLFSIDQPRLLHVSLGAFLAALLNLLGDYYLWHKLLPELNIRWHDFQKQDFHILFNTGIWTFLYQAGFILFLNVDLVVANRTLDLHLVGMYAALLTIPKTLRMLSIAIGGTWGPTVIAKHGRSDHKGVDVTLRRALKLTGFSLALPIGLLCGLSRPFLDLWLGPDFQAMSLPLTLMLIPLSTNLLSGVFFDIYVAFNKLKTPSMVAISLGLTNLLLAIILAPRYGIIGIITAGILTLTLNSSVFAPIYAAKIMNLSCWYYLQRLAGILFAVGCVTMASYLISDAIHLTSYLHLLLAGGVVSLVYIPLAYFFALSTGEKELLQKAILKVIGNNQ